MAIVQPPKRRENRSVKVLSRCPRLEPSVKTVEAIEQAVEERVVVRLDDVWFNKKNMKKMSELVKSDPKDGLAHLFAQLWHVLTRQQPKKSRIVKRRWKPALQSIPEEI